MWRYFKSGILGVIIGIVGGIVAGQISYVKSYKNKFAREIMDNAALFVGAGPQDKTIRLKVDYDGEGEGLPDNDQIESYVGNIIMEQVKNMYGDSGDTSPSYIQMRHSLVMAMDQINNLAKGAASDLGIDVDADTGFSYEYFGSAGDELPAGYYDTLCIDLADR